jgi:hypothetical protein
VELALERPTFRSMPRAAAEVRSEDPAPEALSTPVDPLARRGEQVLFVLLALLSVLLLAQLLDFGYGRDQALYAVVSDALLRGDVPYRDAWDFKPPGIYFTYAFARAVFGQSIFAVRILEALGLVSLFYAYAVFSRRHVGARRAGLLGASAAILAYVPLEFWYTGQPEGFGAIALAWALVCASYEPRHDSGRRGEVRQFAAWAAAAFLYAFAALLKPPLGGGILVSFGFVLASRWRARGASGPGRTLGLPTLAFAAGAALPLLATFAYFSASGALADLREALFAFAPVYTALQLERTPFPALLARSLFEWLFRTAPYNVVGLAALLLLPALHPRERRGVAHVLGVIAFSLIGVALQAKFFLYHYAAVLPLTGLLAGWGYWKVWIRVRGSALAGLAAAAVLCAVTLDAVPGLPNPRPFWSRTAKRLSTLSQPALRTPVRDALYSLGDVDARSNREVAEWLRENTPEDSTLFVWGFEPAIYALSRRRPASRYVDDVPQRAAWAKEKSRRILIGELTASPPAVIVVVHEDRLPWVTGNRQDSFESLRDFPELLAMLQRQYRLATRFGDLEIRLRNDL